MKQGVIIGFLGKTQDRFSDYHESADTCEKLKLAARVPGFKGIEMVFPYETTDAEATVRCMQELDLEFAAINVNIKKEAQFVPGALSRPVKEIRQEAVAYIKRAKDFAQEVGAPLVTCCPLSDGNDHLFQVNYRQAWKHTVETFGEAADYKPHIPLFIEPKYNETRVHCTIDTTMTGLLLLKEIGQAATGITLDFGHSMYAGENPARSLMLIADSGFQVYIHTNDNDARHDWDLAAGSRHFLHFAELLFYARHIGYDRYFTTDASPRIFDRVGYFTHHARFSDALWRVIGQLDSSRFFRLMEAERSLELMDLVQQQIYRLP